MTHRFLYTCLLLLSVSAIFAQKLKFYADVDARKVVEGSFVEVRFVLENAQGTSFKLPKMADFTVVSGPSTSQSTKIYNGSMTSEIGYGYGLKPNGLGTKKIPSATIVVNGRTLKTTPITIEVVKAASGTVPNDKQIFVETSLTDTSTFVGQQIILEYKLYTLVDVRNIKFGIENEFDGFFSEELTSSQRGYIRDCLLYTSPSPRDKRQSRMPSSA